MHVIDDHKRLMMIISSGDVTCANAVMRAGLKRNMSIHAIIGLFEKAGANLYSVKSFSEQEKALGLLFLHLGGAQLAGIAHRALGLPAVCTLQHAHPMQPLLVSSHQPMKSELEQNILVSLNAGLFNKESVLTDALSKTTGYVLMFDEIKIEEIIHYSASNNQIVGVCHEHSGRFVLEYSSMHKASHSLRESRTGMFILLWR